MITHQHKSMIKRNILILGKSTMQRFDGTTLKEEDEYSINFTDILKNFENVFLLIFLFLLKRYFQGISGCFDIIIGKA